MQELRDVLENRIGLNIKRVSLAEHPGFQINSSLDSAGIDNILLFCNENEHKLIYWETGEGKPYLVVLL